MITVHSATPCLTIYHSHCQYRYTPCLTTATVWAPAPFPALYMLCMQPNIHDAWTYHLGGRHTLISSGKRALCRLCRPWCRPCPTWCRLCQPWSRLCRPWGRHWTIRVHFLVQFRGVINSTACRGMFFVPFHLVKGDTSSHISTVSGTEGKQDVTQELARAEKAANVLQTC